MKKLQLIILVLAFFAIVSTTSAENNDYGDESDDQEVLFGSEVRSSGFFVCNFIKLSFISSFWAKIVHSKNRPVRKKKKKNV